jgi:hypothetical protein
MQRQASHPDGSSGQKIREPILDLAYSLPSRFPEGGSTKLKEDRTG